MSEVTRVLSAIEGGDPHAAEQLLPLVYQELRQLAAQKFAQEKPGQTLEATALVHEALSAAGRRGEGATLGQPRRLLRRCRGGYAPHPGGQRPAPRFPKTGRRTRTHRFAGTRRALTERSDRPAGPG